MKLAILADLHLGNRHLNSDEREQDFYEAFGTTKRKLLELNPDVILVAGDLFHDRMIRPETLAVARENLEAFKRARIPVYIVPGNHDKAMYSDKKTWLEVLEDQGLIRVLGNLEEVPIGNDCSLVGMPFAGHREREVLQELWNLPKPKAKHRFLLCHIGVAEVKPGIPGCVSAKEFDSFQKIFDAVFTGHFHSPWDNGFVFCPGALGYTSIADRPGGFYLYNTTQSGSRVTFYPLEGYYPLRQVVRADLADIGNEQEQVPEGAIWRVTADGPITRQEVEQQLVWAKPLRVQVVYEIPAVQGQQKKMPVNRPALVMQMLEDEMGADAQLGYQVLQAVLQGAETDEILDMVYQGHG